MTENRHNGRAPFAGTIIGKYYNDGEIYSAMKPGPEGLGAILSLAKLNRMKIEVNVPEMDFVRISEGIPAVVSVDALGTRKFLVFMKRTNGI
jgi:multidrug resistance efflux pump